MSVAKAKLNCISLSPVALASADGNLADPRGAAADASEKSQVITNIRHSSEKFQYIAGYREATDRLRELSALDQDARCAEGEIACHGIGGVDAHEVSDHDSF